MKVQLLFVKSESDIDTKTFIIKNLNYKILDFIKNKIAKEQKITKEYIDFIKIYIMKSIEQESSEKTKYDVFIDCNYNLDMYRIALNVSLKVAIQSIKTFFKTL